MKDKRNQTVSIHYDSLRTIAAYYLSAPVIIFLIGFLKWYFAIPGVCAVLYVLFSIRKEKKNTLNEERKINISIWSVAGVFLLMLIWTHLGGMNGYWYQSSDYSARNAVLRDLVTHSWPVTYQNDSSALVYYIGHWLPAAVIGKITNGFFHSMRLTWLSARVALWIWSSIGLTIVAVLLFLFVQADNRKKRIISILLLIFFSGMDIIGALLEHKLEANLSPNVLHLEWWTPKYWQYSSITTCLYWVFNQAIVPWLIVMLILIDSNPRYYILYIASCLICAPMPAVGICILMAGKEIAAIVTAFREHSIKARIKHILSLPNVLVFITCIPVLAAYILCSSAAADIEAKTTTAQTGSITHSLIQFGLFYALEAGIILLILWSNNKNNILFYVIGLSLLIIPRVHVGTGTDFCMRGSIPAIFVLMVYTLDYLVSSKTANIGKKRLVKQKCLTTILIIVLLLGATTPAIEIFRGIYHVVNEKNMKLVDDSLYSFENNSDSYNFTTANYKDHLFYSVFAKGH